MQLYHRWKCPWCAAARQAIANVGVDVELIEVPYARRERTAVMAVSGQARVPVLVDGDDVVVESPRVVHHLYSRYGGEPLAAEAAELGAAVAAMDVEADGGYCELPDPPGPRQV